jgi:preprotein translocase subunit Sec61beta
MRLRIGFCRAAIFSVLALSPLDARAQPADEDRRSVRIAGGVVSQGGIFGDDDPLRSNPRLGATVSIGIRRHPTHRVGLAFETAFEPVPIRNPHFDESVSRVYLQLGPEIGQRVYVRPTAGGAVSFWSGTMSSSGLSLAPALAVAAGYRHTIRSGIRIQPELVIRVAAEVGAVTWSTGAQIAVSLPKW